MSFTKLVPITIKFDPILLGQLKLVAKRKRLSLSEFVNNTLTVLVQKPKASHVTKMSDLSGILKAVKPKQKVNFDKLHDLVNWSMV